MTTAELKKDSKVNKELKAEFLTKLFDNYKCSDKWKAYYTKDIEDVCRINDKDEYFYIDKPYIKKSFCFGYGMYLQSTEEESNRANDMAVKAQTDVTYFINSIVSFLLDSSSENLVLALASNSFTISVE